MKAADVMVSNVITVGVDASIGEVAATLLNNNISGAPVVGGSKGIIVRRRISPPRPALGPRNGWRGTQSSSEAAARKPVPLVNPEQRLADDGS